MKLCEIVFEFHHRPSAISQNDGTSTRRTPCNSANEISSASHVECRSRDGKTFNTRHPTPNAEFLLLVRRLAIGSWWFEAGGWKFSTASHNRVLASSRDLLFRSSINEGVTTTLPGLTTHPLY